MSDTTERLEKCFTLALSEVPKEDIRRALKSSVAEWDSLVIVNFLSLIEEEFGIQIPDEDLGNFTSFELIADYLRLKTHDTQS